MNKRPVGSLPSSKTIGRHAKDIGADMWKAYITLRAKYRQKGLTPREAVERSCKELQIMERWQDWKVRADIARATGQDVAATNDEVRQYAPGYRSPAEVTAESVGEREMTFAEEVLWARDQNALVKSGSGPPPTHFPNKAALSWYLYSISNHEKFMTMVANISKPQISGDDAYMKDGEYRFKEIESQLVEALKECGEKLIELEKGFAEQLEGALSGTEALD